MRDGEAADRLARIDPARDLPSLVCDDAVVAPHEQHEGLPLCASCGGAGWVKEAVPFSHPHFGVLFPCTCT